LATFKRWLLFIIYSYTFAVFALIAASNSSIDISDAGFDSSSFFAFSLALAALTSLALAALN
jgi:hypothetical protein